MIKLSGVSKDYPGGNRALRDINLEISGGEFVFLTGHSGAGKSTLLRMLALLERPSQGQVIIQGRNLERLSAAEVPYFRRRLGVIFQEHHLLPERSAFENVALPLRISGFSNNETRKRARAALDKVNLLHREQALTGTLSTGEQQRIVIARAVVNRPLMLLADEPTGNLDASLSHEILNLLVQFNQVGVTVILATHDLDLLSARGGRRIGLNQGELEPPAEATQ